jgi:hypothetical protein
VILLFYKEITALNERKEDIIVLIYNHDLFVLLFEVFARFTPFAEGLAGAEGSKVFPVLPNLPITLASCFCLRSFLFAAYFASFSLFVC